MQLLQLYLSALKVWQLTEGMEARVQKYLRSIFSKTIQYNVSNKEIKLSLVVERELNLLGILFLSFGILFQNTNTTPLLPFRLPFFIFERFSTSGRRKWQQFHQVVPSSPPMITIEVSNLAHALKPNGLH